MVAKSKRHLMTEHDLAGRNAFRHWEGWIGYAVWLACMVTGALLVLQFDYLPEFAGVVAGVVVGGVVGGAAYRWFIRLIHRRYYSHNLNARERQ